MKRILRQCIHQTMRKRVDESKLRIRQIEIPEKDVSYFNLSSNLIISFCHRGKQYYFRECPRVLKADAFFERETERFFKTLNRLHISEAHFKQQALIPLDFSPEAVSGFREYISRKRANPRFLKALADADKISRKTNFSIWEDRDYDGDFFAAWGLADLPVCCRNIAVYFLWCMRGASQAYRTLSVVRGETYSYFSALKSVASRIVADALGLGALITFSEFCCVKLDNGESMFGLLCDAAPGSRMLDSRVQPCGSLQKELMDLSLLDLICVQTDHGPNNYNVAFSDGAYRICAFDNDNPNTFLPLPLVRRSVLGCSRLIGADGLVNRPYVSRELYDGIRNVRFDRLRMDLRPYLNVFQITALLIRIRRVQKALERTVRKRPGFVLDHEEWNARTAAEELSGEYGRTYLTIALLERG